MMEGFKIRQNQDLKRHGRYQICEKCCSFDKCTLKFNFKLFCRTLFCPDSILSKSYFDHKLNCPAAILTYSPFDLMLNCPMLFWPAIFCLTLFSPVTMWKSTITHGQTQKIREINSLVTSLVESLI